MASTDNMYWNSTGKYQALYEQLADRIPDEGSVKEPKKNRALEKLRVASNCYYDLFNNGLCNRAAEFRRVFGFGGTWIAKNGYPFHQPLETALDEIILAAAKEQGIAIPE